MSDLSDSHNQQEFWTPRQELKVGNVVGQKYRIEAILAQGGMGRIYRAFDQVNSRQVALKQFLAIPGSDLAELEERFQREYHFLNAIDHPNLVKAYDFLWSDNEMFLVLEFVIGVSLQKLVADSPFSLSLCEQICIANQAARAVDVLNTAGILHRDIKPANIMLDGEAGSVKLLDLGLGKTSAKASRQLTQAGMVLGTAEYLSPEQANCQLSEKTDVFSLGVTLYQFFLWQTHSPFASEAGRLRVLMDVMSKQLLPLHKVLASQWPERKQRPGRAEETAYRQLSACLEKATRKDPEQRPSAGDVADRLAVIYRDLCRSSDLRARSTPWRLSKESEVNVQALRQVGEKYGRDLHTGNRRRAANPHRSAVGALVARRGADFWCWLAASMVAVLLLAALLLWSRQPATEEANEKKLAQTSQAQHDAPSAQPIFPDEQMLALAHGSEESAAVVDLENALGQLEQDMRIFPEKRQELLPYYLDKRVELADVHAREQRMEKEISTLQQTFPQTAVILWRLAQRSSEAGLYRQARHYLTCLQSEFPQHQPAAVNRLATLVREKLQPPPLSEERIQLRQLLLALHEARMHSMQRQWTQSDAALQRAVALAQQPCLAEFLPFLRCLLSMACLREEKMAQAREQMDTNDKRVGAACFPLLSQIATRAGYDSLWPETQFVEGVYCFLDGQYEQSIKVFKEFQKNFLHYPSPDGELSTLIKDFLNSMQYKKTHPLDYTGRLLRIFAMRTVVNVDTCLQRGGEQEIVQALMALEDIACLENCPALVQCKMAECMLRLNRIQPAIDCLIGARRWTAVFPDPIFWLACIAERQGDTQRAYRYFSYCQKYPPRNVDNAGQKIEAFLQKKR